MADYYKEFIGLFWVGFRTVPLNQTNDLETLYDYYSSSEESYTNCATDTKCATDITSDDESFIGSPHASTIRSITSSPLSDSTILSPEQSPRSPR